MARAIWTGSLSFGLVNIPVGLHTATEDKTIHFNQFQAGTSDRVRIKRVNERTGEEVEYSQIVKGYDLGGGEYVIVTPDELEAIEPGRSRTIDISDFVDLEDIDPIYYKSTYYLAPNAKDGNRAYGLLLEAMRDAGKVGIATFVLRGKQHLVAVRPEDDVLVLETMFFADEIRDPTVELGNLPTETTFQPREIETAKLLIDSMSAKWDPERYEDSYRQKVEEMIDRKRQGQVVAVARAPEQAPNVVDLMQALRASVEAAKSSRMNAGSEGVVPDAATGVVGSTTAGSRGPKRAPAGSATARAELPASSRPRSTPSRPRAGSRPPAATEAAPTTAQGSRPRRRERVSEDLAALSKSELYELAAKLDIPGRSKMDRKELELAVAAAPARRRRAS
jgi:DNA end-binding protein Ku